jgi:hypothetical protein
MQNHETPNDAAPKPTSWNKGKLIGPKPPLRPKHVWAIRTKLQLEGRTRDLAMFNVAIDSKLRGCDVVKLKVEDVAPHGQALDRATVRQRKTGQPVRFELTEPTREAIDGYIKAADKRPGRLPWWLQPSHLDQAVCPAGVPLDCQHWPEPKPVRNALAAPNKGHADLPPNREPACRSAAARPHQDRKHRSLLGY